MKDNIPQDLIDQYGFTLIELMISLVLGLLISAAVMQVFLTSQRVDRIQTAGSEIQDKAVFGLQSIEPQIRLANLGNDGVAINDMTALGGIVLTAGEYDGSSDKAEQEAKDKAEQEAKDKAAEEAKDKAAEEAKDKAAEVKAQEERDKAAEAKAQEERDKAAEAKAQEERDKAAQKLEDEADVLEAEAEDIEGEIKDLRWFGRLKAPRMRREAAEKRKDAANKREAAAQIRNQSAYNFRNFQRPEFQRAGFQRADFQRAGFQRADFQRADFQRADFQRADFQRADFQRTSFQRADFQRASFQRVGFQRADFQRPNFQRVGFQKVAASSSSGLFNVMVKGGLDKGYLTRSHEISSAGGSATWGGLSNTGQPSDQLTIQYINTTGRVLYDCEGEKVERNDRVITRYFITDSDDTVDGARKNLNLNCDAGRITSDGELEDFTDDGATIIENIDQFNIRLGVHRSITVDGALSYEFADMTVADYMDLDSKPPITNIRLAILARSTANSPDASADTFAIFGDDQSLKEQDDAPKYLRRVYEANILLRNARIMHIVDSSVT